MFSMHNGCPVWKSSGKAQLFLYDNSRHWTVGRQLGGGGERVACSCRCRCIRRAMATGSFTLRRIAPGTMYLCESSTLGDVRTQWRRNGGRGARRLAADAQHARCCSGRSTLGAKHTTEWAADTPQQVTAKEVAFARSSPGTTSKPTKSSKYTARKTVEAVQLIEYTRSFGRTSWHSSVHIYGVQTVYMYMRSTRVCT